MRHHQSHAGSGHKRGGIGDIRERRKGHTRSGSRGLCERERKKERERERVRQSGAGARRARSHPPSPSTPFMDINPRVYAVRLPLWHTDSCPDTLSLARRQRGVMSADVARDDPSEMVDHTTTSNNGVPIYPIEVCEATIAVNETQNPERRHLRVKGSSSYFIYLSNLLFLRLDSPVLLPRFFSRVMLERVILL